MPAGKLTAMALSVAATVLSSTTAFADLGGAQGGAGGDSVSSWVIGNGPGGGVAQLAGTTCGPWDAAANLSAQSGAADVGTVRQDQSGLAWVLYYRMCGSTMQDVWVPLLPPGDLGRLAFDEVVKKLPKPSPALFPDLAIGGYVNFETWLALTDPGDVTAIAAIPGLSATATARVVRIEWSPGDGSMVRCVPFGALPPTPGYMGRAPCGHTFTQPSLAAVTGSPDDRFHGSVTLVWAASWTSSNGGSGDLGEATSTVPFVYRVREIQTIGAGG